MTLTLSLTWGHWRQNNNKIDRGLNQQSLYHWSCALSIELRLLVGFRAVTMNICFMIDIIVDIIIVRTTQEVVMTLTLALTLSLTALKTGQVRRVLSIDIDSLMMSVE